MWYLHNKETGRSLSLPDRLQVAAVGRAGAGSQQLVHSHLLCLFGGAPKQLLLGKLQLFQKPLILQCQAGNDLRLFLLCGSKLRFQLGFFALEFLIFRAGNGNYFIRVTCRQFFLFHDFIIPQSPCFRHCFYSRCANRFGILTVEKICNYMTFPMVLSTGNPDLHLIFGPW